MTFILTPANSYVVDAYRNLSSEMFISNMMMFNTSYSSATRTS